MEEFLKGAGDDMNFISCELDKLTAYVGDNEEITSDDIRAVCCVQTETRLFDMVADIAAGRRGEAIKSYNELLQLKESPVKILAIIEKQYRQLLEIRELYGQGKGERIIAETLKLHPYAVKKNLEIAKRYSSDELKSILRQAASFDEDIKTGIISDKTAVEFLLVQAADIKQYSI